MGRVVSGVTVTVVDAPMDRGVDMSSALSVNASAFVPARVTVRLSRTTAFVPCSLVRVKGVGLACALRSTVNALEAGDAVSREPAVIWLA